MAPCPAMVLGSITCTVRTLAMMAMTAAAAETATAAMLARARARARTIFFLQTPWARAGEERRAAA